MLIRHSFDQRFTNLLEKLEKKYGTEMFDIDGISSKKLDINLFAKDFFKTTNKVADISVDGNANVEDGSILGFEHEFNKSLMRLNAYYLIWKLISQKKSIRRANKVIEDCISGRIYINDLNQFIKPYCYSFDLMNLITEGFPFISKLNIDPPKRLSSFVDLTIQAITFISNQIAGAASFPSLFVCMNHFVEKEYGEDWYKRLSEIKGNRTLKQIIEQEFQKLTYSFNFPYRHTQSPFTNVSIMDKYFLESLFGDNYYFPDGSKPNLKNVDYLQKMFLEWFNEENKIQPFTFPVITASLAITDDNEHKDKEFLDYISKQNLPYGVLNIFQGKESVLSSCCRLRLDTNVFASSLGTSSISIGSTRVACINLPRIALESEGRSKRYFSYLKDALDSCYDVLEVHRELLIDYINRGKLPLYTKGWMSLKRQFSTVGFIGMHEAVSLCGKNIQEKTGLDFAIKILEFLNKKNDERAKLTENMYNVEQIPGESAASKLMQKDMLVYKIYKPQAVLYSNQYTPLIEDVPVLNRIKVHGHFDSLTQGGGILHINMKEKIESWEQMKQIIEYSCKKGVRYFAINYNIARCSTCNKVHIGKFELSPCCNSKVFNYTRVVGFLTNVEAWTKPRRIEYPIRKFYEELIEEEHLKWS